MALSLSQQLLLAVQVAARAHQGQKRKDSTPYFAHPVRVSYRVVELAAERGVDPIQTQIVALLHDVVEDTEVTMQELRELGFSHDILAALDGVTKKVGESYRDFIDRCGGSGDIAIAVKLADIDDNLEDQSALDPEEAEFLRKRYTKARERLLNA